MVEDERLFWLELNIVSGEVALGFPELGESVALSELRLDTLINSLQRVRAESRRLLSVPLEDRECSPLPTPSGVPVLALRDVIGGH